MPNEPQSIVLGEAILDMVRGTLTRDGEVLGLRSKPFRLLCELARQADRVVPRAELLDAVWPDVIVTDASLTQAVYDIRKALKDDEGRLLRTVARRGFMLCPTRHVEGPPRAALQAPPRIALLPWANRTGDPRFGPMLEGLVEEITAGLARFQNLTVVARHSAFAAAADPNMQLPEIGAKLRADYLVDGSARLDQDRLVLALSLNDVRSDVAIWGESFVLDGTGWLTLQDLVPRRIAQRLSLTVEEASRRESLRRSPAELSAFDHLSRGRALMRSVRSGPCEEAHAHFTAAIEADPTLGVAHSYLGLVEITAYDFFQAPLEVKEHARNEGLRGVQLSPEDSRCQGLLSLFHTCLAEFEPAEEAARRAVALNPCDADALHHLASVLLSRGRPQECLDWLDRAKDINPLWPEYYDLVHAMGLLHLDRHEEAARLLSRITQRSAHHEIWLAASYAMAGDVAQARRHAEHTHLRHSA
ncbi:transcriptional regulatory protein-like type [Rubellimicrobium mesophilum DSM 19309]|uniref:Transcriptional regulatory protein-like type n=1 Tax=Rubellimicrobium mesophilum DSM 19309 TaxID=442562 RepID=A0A017HN89_9RHOB|nr:winged helix-turn-helix domain-containing protein [Rubellimicrobium mesophilum]EYD75598.1 transcriptional regulatory protein-like type [Rubellimicrobium mesophilum DSM 19309]